MLILTRYFSREFIRVFLLCMAVFEVLFLLVDLIDRADDIVAHQAPLGLVVQYCLCNLPMVFNQSCPLAVLLATVITLGMFVRSHEITALKAHGISLYRVLRIFLILACVLCGLSLWMQQYVLPYTTGRAEQIKHLHIKGRSMARLFQKHHFWYRSGARVYYADFFEPERVSLHRVTILEFGADGFLQRRIDAPLVRWQTDAWQCPQGTERTFSRDGRTVVAEFAQRQLEMGKVPQDFYQARKEGQEMSFSEISRAIAQMRREGYPSRNYEVDLHAKVSYAFVNIIMALLGIPFALRIGRSGGMALGVALSIVLGLGYWTFYTFCLSLGSGGVVPPVVAAWTANVAFGMLGAYLFLQVRQ